jgi:hypothetical protein
MIILNAKGMEKLNTIADKYRFRNYIEIEQDEVYDFCDSLIRCTLLGLSVDKEDYEFIRDVRDKLT